MEMITQDELSSYFRNCSQLVYDRHVWRMNGKEIFMPSIKRKGKTKYLFKLKGAKLLKIFNRLKKSCIKLLKGKLLQFSSSDGTKIYEKLFDHTQSLNNFRDKFLLVSCSNEV